MQETVEITIQDHEPAQVPSGTAVVDVLPAAQPERPWIAAKVNNDLVSLTYPLRVNASIQPLTQAEPDGWRVYRMSMSFLVCKAVHDLWPQTGFSLAHAIGPGLYCNLDLPQARIPAACEQLKQHIDGLVAQSLPIERRRIAFTEAFDHFDQCGFSEKKHLLEYRNPPGVVLHVCGDFCDIAHGPLTPDTHYLSRYQLIPYEAGFIIQLPTMDNPFDIPPFQDQPHLFNVFKKHRQWGKTQHVATAADLNRLTYEKQVDPFIMTAEALHEKQLSRIADQIADNPTVKVVLIAGPSSAGKTTFAKRLAIHLTVNGLQPVTLSTDDYFVGEARNPLGPDGKPDFEHIEAVDLDAFNHDLMSLSNGASIKQRRFDFNRKTPVWLDAPLQLAPDQILLIEGIHGLNPRLTQSIPAERKFKIYVNALTQLNVDSHNRISTTDNRLIRRMVRDHQFRGHSALQTLGMWPMVRRGEQRWIFPFQQEADATFNSALDYELGVLKSYVEPLLMQIKPSMEAYAQSRRLSEFLLNFIPIPENVVPGHSILREYIGNSSLRY